MKDGVELAQESKTSMEQAPNAKQTSNAIEDVNEITQQAAYAAEEMAFSTEESSSIAQQLQGLAAKFKIDESEMAQAQNAGALPEPGRKGKTGEKRYQEEVTGITVKKDKAA